MNKNNSRQHVMLFHSLFVFGSLLPKGLGLYTFMIGPFSSIGRKSPFMECIKTKRHSHYWVREYRVLLNRQPTKTAMRKVNQKQEFETNLPRGTNSSTAKFTSRSGLPRQATKSQLHSSCGCHQLFIGCLAKNDTISRYLRLKNMNLLFSSKWRSFSYTSGLSRSVLFAHSCSALAD